MKDPMTPFSTGDSPAQLRYYSGDYEVVVPGRHVLCAVTGDKIPLAHLRYWNADLQEAYANCEVATRRMIEWTAEGK